MSGEIVFLLGAGASVPADIPVIGKLTGDFMATLTGSGLDAANFLKEILMGIQRGFDIE